MELQNISHQHISQKLAPKAEVNLEPFWRILLHSNGNVSCNIRFWIFACGGNTHQWTNVLLCAELWAHAQLHVEQEPKLYFAEKANCGMFCSLYIFACSIVI